eukprot:5905840-Heterocapsa_arctica.AAC.1
MGVNMTWSNTFTPCCMFADDFIILGTTLNTIKHICAYIMDCLIGCGTGLDFKWEKNELVSNVLGSGGKAITIKGRE